MPLRSTLVAVMALALVAAACTGSRTAGTAAGAGAGSSTTATTRHQAQASFGDLPSPCGPGDATGATDQGVTDDTIVIGYGDDAGFTVLPGLNHEIGDAVRAMVKWCNAQGGINGRQIDARYYDAKFTDAVNVVQDACRQVFMLVGQGWANDAAEEPTRLGCKLPEVPGYVVTATNAPLMVQGLPNPVDVNSSTWGRQLAEAFPDKVKKAAVMYGNVPASIDAKDKLVASFPKFGWQFLDCSQEWNVLGEADWRPFAQKLKQCGAEAVNFIGPPYPNFENLLEAAALAGYRPVWFADVNNYDPNLARWNTNGYGDNLYVRLPFVPFEEARDNRAMAQYVDLVEKNGGDIAPLGVQATSSFLLWATGAKECGSRLTRQCVMANLTKVTEWTAGGLHAETNPGGNLGPECGMLVKLQGTKYVRFAPERVNTFDCSPGDNVEIPRTERVVAQAHLGPDRISTTFGK
jgi:ABC-type branched-subunit amino acid transport system substrate-binding protein